MMADWGIGPTLSCPLCGYRFGRQEALWACQRCPVARGCHLLRCPNCGYEWAEHSRLVDWIRTHLKR